MRGHHPPQHLQQPTGVALPNQAERQDQCPTHRHALCVHVGMHIYICTTHIVKSSCFSFYRDSAFSQLAGEMVYMKTWVQIPAVTGHTDVGPRDSMASPSSQHDGGEVQV